MLIKPKIAHEKNITIKADLFKYLETNDPELYKDLPKYDKFRLYFLNFGLAIYKNC